MLTTSLSQLKMVQGKLAESQESLSTINSDSKSKEILVPLTGSVSLNINVQFPFTLFWVHCGMKIPLSDDKHRFVRDS